MKGAIKSRPISAKRGNMYLTVQIESPDFRCGGSRCLEFTEKK